MSLKYTWHSRWRLILCKISWLLRKKKWIAPVHGRNPQRTKLPKCSSLTLYVPEIPNVSIYPRQRTPDVQYNQKEARVPSAEQPARRSEQRVQTNPETSRSGGGAAAVQQRGVAAVKGMGRCCWGGGGIRFLNTPLDNFSGECRL